MKTDSRLYAADAEAHALNLLRSGYWVRLRMAPHDSDADHQVDSVAPPKMPPPMPDAAAGD